MSAATLAPARTARDRTEARLLVLEPEQGPLSVCPFSELPSWLDPGDLLVFNDAATLPASLRAQLGSIPIELRLAGASPAGYWAVLFGPGSWRQRTETRPPPPLVSVGTVLRLATMQAEVVAIDPRSPRLVELRFSLDGDALWKALYTEGRPIQYAYHRAPLARWSVQNSYGARPVAMELPAAGRAFTFSTFLALRRRGIGLAWLTHAAGLSSTGDPALDRRLPLPEQFEIPAITSAAVTRARAAGRRVLAVGTSVVRALESSARMGCAAGVTELRLGPTDRLEVVTDLLTGMHVEGESHYELLHTFLHPHRLAQANRLAAQEGMYSHEFGDLTLILRRRGAGRLPLSSVA